MRPAPSVSAGIPVLDLTEYSGIPVDAVKVGTIKRAKGLEFKQTLLPRVPASLVDAKDSDDEAVTIQRRELYVGMTRARDGLWVGSANSAGSLCALPASLPVIRQRPHKARIIHTIPTTSDLSGTMPTGSSTSTTAAVCSGLGPGQPSSASGAGRPGASDPTGLPARIRR